jgi:hypothetical protein
MKIFVDNRRKKIETIQKNYPDGRIIDVTSKGTLPFVKFSPFYSIGDIPVPFSDNLYSNSVEGVWQGLKVFEGHDIDLTKLRIKDMKGLKRTVSSFGLPKGHRKGINGTELLDYISARKQIYIPVYNWVLANKLKTELEQLREICKVQTLVLLDYETNGDVENPSKPLSHAYLIKYKLEEMS